MKIQTLEEFRKIKSLSADEFIVVIDYATGDTVHIVRCVFVKESDFETKVLENKEKFGEYYHFETYEEAKQRIPSISICKFCSKYFRGKK